MPRLCVDIKDEYGIVWKVFPADFGYYDIISKEAEGTLLMDTLMRGIPLDSLQLYKDNLEQTLDIADDMNKNGTVVPHMEQEIIHAIQSYVYYTKLTRMVEEQKTSVHGGSRNRVDGSDQLETSGTKPATKRKSKKPSANND